jgi:hypothetical protein
MSESEQVVSGWKPIETAPLDGTLLRLKSPSYEPDEIFWWAKRKKRWECRLFAVARVVPGWWSKDDEQPTYWKPASPPTPSGE